MPNNISEQAKETGKLLAKIIGRILLLNYSIGNTQYTLDISCAYIGCQAPLALLLIEQIVPIKVDDTEVLVLQ